MRISRRVGAACAAAALTILSATSASADTFYNNLDGTIDSELETMALTYDSSLSMGSTGSTIVRIRVDSADDHAGCNIQGAPQYVTLTATSSNTAAVVLENGPTYTFNACTDTRTVQVRAVGLGSSDITFSVTDDRTSNDPKLTWNTLPAAFTVSVTEGSGGTSTGCDADPAAPAWAAAILQKSGYKLKDKSVSNYVSTIAQEMQQMADFAGFQKGDNWNYANAVRTRLVGLTGNSGLASVDAAARPGWTCAPTS